MRYENLSSDTCDHDPNNIGYLLAWSLAKQHNEPLICRRCGQTLWSPEQEKPQNPTGLAGFLKQLRQKLNV
ncbi:MAG: hypothetical protein HPY54_10110 [Chthonomonadetes bacterium]|nr:hypothetical protein [Chthonomonadetes bacterium]